jgi:hypothetical protein
VPRIVFENYRRNGRYWNPTKVTIVQNSWTIITSDLQSIRRDFDRTLSAADFAPPPGAIEVDQKSFDFHVSKVAPSYISSKTCRLITTVCLSFSQTTFWSSRALLR